MDGGIFMNEIEFNNEKIKLNKTLEIIQKILSEEKESFEVLFENFIGDREELWKIADSKKIHINNLEVAIDKPYI